MVNQSQKTTTNQMKTFGQISPKGQLVDLIYSEYASHRAQTLNELVNMVKDDNFGIKRSKITTKMLQIFRNFEFYTCMHRLHLKIQSQV